MENIIELLKAKIRRTEEAVDESTTFTDRSIYHYNVGILHGLQKALRIIEENK